ncbi:DUF4426 domain-containing protein [Marinobacter sp. X15-166B]|uniref:DUF4426 domain-containing protein n=1 Tax=Marinobacter sp. X15-166B TaxID=1897620 RepID=UPI00085CC478|nr:DUF4426 domain-containing protein [Marinobacter sp. X15-166B]OEY66476.1 hypothetical protein BG841_08410 [Marinobacter sp. X15-166B]
MTRLRHYVMVLVATLGLAGLSAQVAAEVVDFGAHQVHYSVFPSTFLSPEVAAANNLNRSRAIGIVNVSVMQKNELGGLQTVPAQMEGRVINDIQQVRFLAFRRIKEGDAIYFIAEFQYREAELLTFQITARPTGSNAELPVRFAHTLYNEKP